MRNKVIAGILTTLVVFSLSGCTTTKETKPEVETPKSNIVVKEDPNKTKQDEPVFSITRLEDIWGLDWIDDNSIIMTKPNMELEPISIEGEQTYPKNIYSLKLTNNETKILQKEPVMQGGARLSPDKEHIFYMEFSEAMATGYISKVTGGQRVKVSREGALDINAGYWVSNEQLLLQNYDREIYLADLKGNIEVVKKSKEPVFDSVKVGDKLYYNTVEGNLYSIDLKTKKETLLQEKVIWVIPSPSQSQLAMVKRTGETKMTLYLTDLEGKELKTLAEGTQIYGTSWSPDGTQLGYNKIDENGKGSLLLFNAETGNSSEVAVNLIAVSQIAWSPSGKKMLATCYENNKETYQVITHIINFK